MTRHLLCANAFAFLRRNTLCASASALALCVSIQSTRAQEATPVPPVNVTAPSNTAAPEGSEAAGYKPETATNFGPFGQMPILDIPYSFNVISSDLLENRVSASTEDVYQISPVVQLSTPNGRTLQTLGYIRGFSTFGIAEDGLRTGTQIYPYALEDKERVEILSGLTGFLYGPTDVGGMVNYVYKRPTATPLEDVTIGDYGNLAGFAHGDFGGPLKLSGIPDGMFAYRLNLVEQHGQLPVDPQSEDKQLVTAVLDWHILPQTTLEVIATHHYEDLHAIGSYWNPTLTNSASQFHYTWVPDPDKLYGQPYTSDPYEIDRAEISLKSQLNSIFDLRVAYSFTNAYKFGSAVENNILTTASNSSGDYTEQTWRNNGIRYQVNSGYGFVDANFNTWMFQHKVTAGYYGNELAQQQGAGGATTVITVPGPFNAYATPVYIGTPNFSSPLSYFGTRYTSSIAAQNNFVLGDEIKFNQYLSALVGGNYAQIQASSFNSTPPFALSSYYNQGRLTPSASLIFKPVPWLSTYGTYSQALEQGAIVPSTGNVIYTNAGQILSPFVDYEIEFGAKADVHGMLLTAALFDINKALQYAIVNPNLTETEVQSGREDHKGIELTAVGNVFTGFRLLGGVTLLDPKIVDNQSNVLLDGKEPPSVATSLAKATMEYDLPFVHGLTLTGGVYYTGPQAADVVNSVFLPSFVTEDIGLRYRSLLPTGQEVIARLNVSNLTDQAYWINPNMTGAPRTIAMSAEIKF